MSGRRNSHEQQVPRRRPAPAPCAPCAPCACASSSRPFQWFRFRLGCTRGRPETSACPANSEDAEARDLVSRALPAHGFPLVTTGSLAAAALRRRGPGDSSELPLGVDVPAWLVWGGGRSQRQQQPSRSAAVRLSRARQAGARGGGRTPAGRTYRRGRVGHRSERHLDGSGRLEGLTP